MSNNQLNNDEKLTKFISEYFGKANKNELEKDIEKGKKLKESKDSSKELTKFANSFIDRYSKVELNSDTCKKMTNEIITKLINLRNDFLPLMNIYMLTKDEINSKILTNHFVLKDKKPTNHEDTNIEEAKLPFVEFGINLSCTYSKDSYYHKFIKGILLYFKMAFKDNYLNEYISDNYFKDIDKSKLYLDNDSTICDSFNKMLMDMYRIVTEQSDKDTKKIKESLIPKIKMNKYQVLRIKAKLHKEPKIGKIYEISNNNEELLSNLDTLLNDDKIKSDDILYEHVIYLKDEIENFIKSEESNLYLHQAKSNNNAELLSVHKINNDLKGEIKNLNNKIDNLENKYNTLMKETNTKINTLTQQNNELNTKIENLSKKVEFMEPIVLSLVYRKAINHSIIKILEKYPTKIKVTKYMNQNNEIQYKITFIDSVNNIDKDTLNRLINNMFSRKDVYNSDSHMINKTLPSFIPDLWGDLKKNLNLNNEEIAAFNAVITEDIILSFNIGSIDLSVKDYLKNIDINKFGK